MTLPTLSGVLATYLLVGMLFSFLGGATAVGRMLAVTESLLGQIYLVTVVALIVANLRPAGGGRAETQRPSRAETRSR